MGTAPYKQKQITKTAQLQKTEMATKPLQDGPFRTKTGAAGTTRRDGSNRGGFGARLNLFLAENLDFDYHLPPSLPPPTAVAASGHCCSYIWALLWLHVATAVATCGQGLGLAAESQNPEIAR